MTTVGITSADRLSLLSREQLETLLQLSQAFNSTIDLDSLLPRILDQTLSVTESEAGSIWVVEGDHVRCVHASGDAASRLPGQEAQLGNGVIGEAVRTGSSVITADALTDDNFAAYRDGPSGFRTRSAVTIPLTVVGQTLGVIQLVNDVGGCHHGRRAAIHHRFDVHRAGCGVDWPCRSPRHAPAWRPT